MKVYPNGDGDRAPFRTGERRLSARYTLSTDDEGGWPIEIWRVQWWAYCAYQWLDRHAQTWLRKLEDRAFADFVQRTTQKRAHIVSMEKRKES